MKNTKSFAFPLTVASAVIIAASAAAAADGFPVKLSQPPQGTMLYGDPVHLVDGKPWAKDPTVIRRDGRYLMYYTVRTPKGYGGAIAESKNLVDWRRVCDIEVSGAPFERGWVAPCAKVFDGKVHLFAQAPAPEGIVTSAGVSAAGKNVIWHATSDDGIHFEMAPGNPAFVPNNRWSVARAIDAEVYREGDSMILAFATREAPGAKIQQLGLAKAPYGSAYGRADWTELTIDAPLLRPELEWEGHCIEAATTIRRGALRYMFYAGSYNHERQQIGLAVSKDGIRYSRCGEGPVLTHGPEGSWNEWESGHPGIFEDDDGKVYLFFQGKATKTGGYSLSCLLAEW